MTVKMNQDVADKVTAQLEFARKVDNMTRELVEDPRLCPDLELSLLRCLWRLQVLATGRGTVTVMPEVNRDMYWVAVNEQGDTQLVGGINYHGPKTIEEWTEAARDSCLPTNAGWTINT